MKATRHMNCRTMPESEVRSALKKMKNGKAAGFDGISEEPLKYGPDILVTRVTSILNGAFQQHTDLKLGHGILVPLQNSGEKKGIRQEPPTSYTASNNP